MYNGRMIKSKRMLFLGIFIFLIPFLGIPTSWKTFFIVVSALALIAMSLKISIPKKTSSKRIRKKEKVTPVYVENSPMPRTDSAREQSRSHSESDDNDISSE
jgi:predicted membrane protein